MQEPVVQAMSSPEPEPEPEPEYHVHQNYMAASDGFFRPDEPFTWASGIKSPVYCDNRLILTAPGVLVL